MSASPDLLAALAAAVQAGPERLAIEEPGGAITHGALWRWAGHVGTWLKGQGIGSGDFVGIAAAPSAGYVAAMLGAWWAGAAFVPLVPELPAARRRWIEDEAAPARILDDAILERLRGEAGEAGEAGETGEIMPPTRPAADDLAYVIFTSGSSGRPKGVRVAFRGILGLLRAQIAAFQHHPGTRALFVLSPAFDAAISDIGTVLLAGGALVIPGAPLLRDPAALLRAIERQRITAIDLPPALLRHLAGEELPRSLETVVIGGEAAPPAIVRRVAARVRVVNVYGPTEATVCVSLGVCDPRSWDRPRLGDPLPGVVFKVLGDGDESAENNVYWRGEGREGGRARPVDALPPGTEGELLIGGPCLALGYLHRPEEEAARFLEIDGERLFRSGDRVRVVDGGGLEFLGRVDRQRKLGGVRIELDEIEAHLAEHPGVRAAAVDVDAGGRVLAWVEPADAARPPTAAELREFLRPRIPAAALPGRVVVVDALPRGVSGKIDRPALVGRVDALDGRGDDRVDAGAGDSVGDRGEASEAREASDTGGAREEGGASGEGGASEEGGASGEGGANAGDGASEPADARALDDPAVALLGALWCRSLGVDRARPGDRFCALGGGSFLALELVAAADACGLVVSAARLLADASFAEVAAALGSAGGEVIAASTLQADVDAELAALTRTCPQGPVESAMLAAAATTSPAPRGRPSGPVSSDMRSTPPPSVRARTRPPGGILLTGATGTLGGPLLRALAQRSRGPLLCLVRARDLAAARERLRPLLPGDARAEVVPVVGDLARPRLGLDDRAWSELAGAIDRVVHAGALVHLAHGHDALRPTNLGGTRSLLELAAAADVRAFHYISTLSVFVGALPKIACPEEDDPLDQTQALIGGYAQSKWAAERLVRAFARGRLPAVIVRLGLVVADVAADRDQLGLFLRGLAELGVVPEGHERLRVDLTPAEVVAPALAELVLRDMSEETSGSLAPLTLHLAAADGATAAQWVAALRRRGRGVREVSADRWRGLARGLGAASPAAAVAYLALCRALGDVTYQRLRPYDLFQATGFRLAGPRGDAALARLGRAIPRVTDEILDRLVARALSRHPHTLEVHR